MQDKRRPKSIPDDLIVIVEMVKKVEVWRECYMELIAYVETQSIDSSYHDRNCIRVIPKYLSKHLSERHRRDASSTTRGPHFLNA